MTSLGFDAQAWIEVLSKLGLEASPIAVSFLLKSPEGIKRLEDQMFFCEMVKRAQEGNAFYADADNHTCDAGRYLLGNDVPSPYTSGEYGTGLQIFNHTRAAKRIYDYVPKLAPGRIRCVALSPLDKLTFEPDLLLLLAQTSSTEILLRSMSYTSGKMWTSKTTSVMGCAWMFIYPYLTGELNYTLTGLGFGMKAKKVFKEGLQVISIPYDLFPTMLQSLQNMPWVLPMFQPDGQEFRKKLRVDLGLDPSH
jgi:uncharacterized protein (DUF169 family)